VPVCKNVLVPAENEKDIKEIPAIVLRAVQIELVEHMDQVLRRALALR
jgi:ATP-dependent Lon protease